MEPANHIQRLILTVDRATRTDLSVVGNPNVKRYFDCPLQLRHKYNFLLHMTFEKDAGGLLTDMAVEYFAPAYRDLSEVGAKIKVYGYPGETDDFMSFSLRIDYYYDMSKEKWVTWCEELNESDSESSDNIDSSDSSDLSESSSESGSAEDFHDASSASSEGDSDSDNTPAFDDEA
jgi:hypothetical protein